MKIAILSDIHDHIDKLQKCLKDIHGKVDKIIFCGDMTSPFTASLLSEAKIPTLAVLGNNDEDQMGIMKKSGNVIEWFNLSQEFGEASISTKKIAFCHYPKLAEFLAKSESFDAVFYGHTHAAKTQIINNSILLNPGAVCGINFDKKTYDKATYALYDTDTNTSGIIEIN